MIGQKYVVGGVELSRPFKARRLGHVGTFQSDLGAARKFYVDELGFRLTDVLQVEEDGPQLGFFTSHGTDHHSCVCIDAALVKGSDPLYDRGITINQISFQVGTLEEVVRGCTYFDELGLSIWRVGRDSPGSNYAVYVRDPDGHNVELFYGMEQVGWDRRSKPLAARKLASEAVDLPQPCELQELTECEAQGASLSNGFRPEEPLPYRFNVGGVTLQRPFKVNRIGCVYLFVSDVERSRAFYERVIGLQVTEEVQWDGHRAVYLRCGTDHHVIGLFPEALRAKIGWPSGTTTLCIGVELCSYQQLRDARQHLSGRGLSLGPTLPHALHPGIDQTAYFADPAGHTIMLYFSMEQVGWNGRPRSAQERLRLTEEWPETIPAAADTYFDQLLQGPLG